MMWCCPVSSTSRSGLMMYSTIRCKHFFFALMTSHKTWPQTLYSINIHKPPIWGHFTSVWPAGSYILKELDGTMIRGSVPASHLQPFYTRHKQIQEGNLVLSNKDDELGEYQWSVSKESNDVNNSLYEPSKWAKALRLRNWTTNQKSRPYDFEKLGTGQYYKRTFSTKSHTKSQYQYINGLNASSSERRKRLLRIIKAGQNNILFMLQKRKPSKIEEVSKKMNQ